MGFFDFLKNLFGSTPKKRLPNLTPPEQGLGTDELARRLGLSVENLERVGVDYHKFDIPKKTGGILKRQLIANTQRLAVNEEYLAPIGVLDHEIIAKTKHLLLHHITHIEILSVNSSHLLP